jgi:antitoxin ParD1/3/4
MWRFGMIKCKTLRPSLALGFRVTTQVSIFDIFGKKEGWSSVERIPMGMNVNLTAQLEEMIRRKVDSGMYNSASEVVRDALRLMDEKDRLRAAKLDQLRQEIQDGLSSGPATTWDREEVKREGLAKRATKTRTAKA